jgi:hypothetical protein
MIDLATLESALDVVGSVGRGELTVTVKGIPVTLSTLSREQQLQVQEITYLGGEEGEIVDRKIERVKLSSLAFSIVQIGKLDLRHEEYVNTGEETAAGVPVRVPRAQAVRKILEKWSHVATMELYQKYLELLRRVEMEAETAIEFEVLDLEAEVQRVTTRLEYLKTELEKVKGQKKPSQIAEVIANNPLPTHKELVEATVAQEQPVPRPVAPTAPRTRVMPPVALPPPVVAQPPAPKEPQRMRDSFGDSAEDLEAESQRLAEARAASRLRMPPHRAALNTANAVVEDSIQAVRVEGPQPDTEAYRVAPIELDRRPPVPPVQKPAVRPGINPNYRPR